MSDRPKLVLDPFGAAADSALPTLKLALDPEVVSEEFKHGLPRLAGLEGRVLVRNIRVTRHKPGKRCVIEYHVKVVSPSAPPARVELIGKIRARRFGNEAYRLLDAFWNAGFQANSSDHISVPQPIGIIPKLQMWLQRKVPGRISDKLLTKPGGIELARHIAGAIHKVHCAGIATERSHTIADELRILQEHLPLVAQSRPDLSARIQPVLEACSRVGGRIPEPKPVGIHRDFYPAQVVVDGTRLYLLDFDLYCLGDPALDMGNFLGHFQEACLRKWNNPGAHPAIQQALEERFVDLAGEAVRPALHAYTLLTLVRHIYLSTRFPERAAFTEPLLALCEQRLAAY